MFKLINEIILDIYNVKCKKYFFSVESCQTDVCEVKRDMIAIKHEIDSVQLVKDEIDDIRESLDRLEAESQRRKNKLLEQVNPYISHFFPSFNITGIYLSNAFFLSRV